MAKLNPKLPSLIYEVRRSKKSRKIDIALTMGMARVRERISSQQYSQLGQDLIAEVVNEMNNSKYFIEFGASDGIRLSNTFLLEKEFGWRGLLAEPGRQWQEDLQRNRVCCIDLRCVWKSSGEYLPFSENGELSGLISHLDTKVVKNNYLVETVEINDLMEFWRVPKELGLLSIDTEGSEFEILNQLNFDKYKFNLIVCEHNYSKNRRKIHKLLTSRGYTRVLVGTSLWDDWYILNDLLETII